MRRTDDPLSPNSDAPGLAGPGHSIFPPPRNTAGGAGHIPLRPRRDRTTPNGILRPVSPEIASAEPHAESRRPAAIPARRASRPLKTRKRRNPEKARLRKNAGGGENENPLCNAEGVMRGLKRKACMFDYLTVVFLTFGFEMAKFSSITQCL